MSAAATTRSRFRTPRCARSATSRRPRRCSGSIPTPWSNSWRQRASSRRPRTATALRSAVAWSGTRPGGGGGGSAAARAAGGGGGGGGGGGNTMTTPDGRTIQLPPGVTEAQVRSAFQKRMSGQELTPAEQSAMAAMRQMMQRAGGGGGGAGGSGGGFRRSTAEPSSYIVFTLKNGKPTPVQIRTGLTDLDYIEVGGGLTEQDTVLVLPSASLLNAQRDMQQRMRNVTGGGLPGVQQQPTTPARPQAAPTRP